MKPKSTFILLALCLAIFGYLYFVDSKLPTTKEVEEGTGRIVTVDRDKVNKLVIKNAEATTELEKKGDPAEWQVITPVKDRADSDTLAELFTTLEMLRSAATVPLEKKKEQLKEFGINDSTLRATFTGDEKPVELIFGKDAAVEGKVYLYVEGRDDVYVIGQELKNQLGRKPEGFRDKKLTELTAQQVTQVTIKSAMGELELTRDGSHWNITKPLQARGDDSKINDLIAQATTARIDKFITDSNLANYGLSEPRGSLTLKVEGQEKPVVIKIGSNPTAEADKEKTHLQVSTREGLVLVPKAIEAALTTPPNDLRDKSLLRIEPDIVDRLTIRHEGAEQFTVARKGESWVRKDGNNDVEINGAVIADLFSEMQSVQVTEFVADVATDLPKYGLDKPQSTVSFSSFATGNTAETSAGEKPIVQLLFGRVDGEKVYVKLDNEPFVLAVPATALTAIPASTISLHPLSIYNFQPAEITALEVTHDGQPTVALQKDGTTWKLAKGDGKINEAAAQKAADTLATLSASRWAGPLREEHGLAKPRSTITFTVKQGEKTSTHKLLLGAASTDGLVYSTAEGKTGVFLTSQPAFTALQAPLTDKQTAPAPAAAHGNAAAPAPQPMPTELDSQNVVNGVRQALPGLLKDGLYPKGDDSAPAPAPVSAAPAAPAPAAPAQ